MNKKTTLRPSFFILLLLLAVCLVFVFTNTAPAGEQIAPDSAYELLREEKISDVYAYSTTVKIKITTSEIEDFPKHCDYYFETSKEEISSFIDAVKELNTNNAEINSTLAPNETKRIIVSWNNPPEQPSILETLMPIIYIGFGLLIVYLIFKMIAGANKSNMNFGKSKARAVANIKVRFSDIAGADEEKDELKEVVEFLKNPQKFTDLGARIPKGILLVGYPGTGKTLLARAIAGESNVPFLSISGSDFVEMFVGVGASRVRDLFEQAKKLSPCIVFIDEIDAVGRQRGAGLGGGNDEREQTLNQLLVEMDGFEANEGIIVLAATNRSDVLDPALLRPGRFDRQIYVHVPDVRGREGILKIHARNKPMDTDIDFKVLARLTSGFTGADIENMLNEAAILAARADRPRIVMDDILEGINKVIMGPQKKSRLVTERDKKITAYHESGHAVLGKVLENCEEVQEVSIIPRGEAAGYTMSRPDTDDSHVTFNKLNDQIAMIMGGRIAEEILIKDISTGAQNDIEKATEIARRMVTEWGMSKKLGFSNFSAQNQVFIGRDYQNKVLYSEKTAAEIDDEIHDILDSNYQKAKKILNSKKDLIEEMAKLLLEKETIFKNEVDMLMEGKTAEEISKMMDETALAKKKKEEEKRREFDLYKKMREIDAKIKTGEVYLKNGIITENDFKALFDEKEKLAKQLEKEILANKQKENVTNKEESNKPEETKIEKPKTEKAKPEKAKKSETENTKQKPKKAQASDEKPKAKKKQTKENDK